MQMIFKTLLRSIRQSLGRFIAIFAIVALGVGFFTGIKSACPSMQKTADNYLRQQKQYDFQLLSSVGFTDDDVAAFEALNGVAVAEGGYCVDILAHTEGDEDFAYQLLSLSDSVAEPSLQVGRMPQSDSECLADFSAFSPADIGKTLSISKEKTESAVELLKHREFVIVGLVKSPRFMNKDRGSTSVGSGKLTGFLYLKKDAFSSEVFHELLLRVDSSAPYLSEDYDELIEALKPSLEQELTDRITARYNELHAKLSSALEDAKASLSETKDRYVQLLTAGTPKESLGEMEAGIQAAEEQIREAETSLAEFTEPVLHVSDLQENKGYASFQNDVEIIDGISNAFPVFFILIAALVCMTTMARMVNDERTQIGTLKAIGFSNTVISLKYILYAGLASLLGCVCGFFAGTDLLPKIIWSVYSIAYGFAPLSYYFSPLMYGLVVSVSVFGAVGVTWLSCRRELQSNPAELIRPKAPGIGKRILLEYVPLLWNRLSFLNKVMLRNAFRYKKRVLLMLLGIGGCTALIVTGFGLKDSVANIMNYQYDDIFHFDASVRFDPDINNEMYTILTEQTTAFEAAYSDTLSVQSENKEREATLIAGRETLFNRYFSLHHASEAIACPKKDEAVITAKTAQQLELSVGDTVWLIQDHQKIPLRISGICDNYIGHYLFVSPDSLRHITQNTVFFQAKNNDIQQLAAELRAEKGVSYVAVAADERSAVDQTMSSMNYIVILVIICAGALAFIVLYNLTNINIMERIREVATVKVLGFRPSETASYVLRENILLSSVGALFGLWLGKLLHRYVMAQVQVDKMMFDVRISAKSYLISLACTVLFALIANGVMQFKLERINMAESLKSVE